MAMFNIVHKAKSNQLSLSLITGLQKLISPSVTTFGVYGLRNMNATRTLSSHNNSFPRAPTISKDESREFMAVFPDIVRELTEKFDEYDSKIASKWFAKALQYNIPHGKKNRGLFTVMIYKQLVDKNDLTPGNIRLAQYLGWCVEMLQGMILITDDVMDGSITRRGQPCWYKLDDVGLTAINDSVMIENSIFYLLKKHFSHTSYFVKLLELFHEAMFITSVGQSLDMRLKNIKHFTMDNYNAIVNIKANYYTFYLPFALAMHMAEFADGGESLHQVKTIIFKIGVFAQTENDYLDCFGDPAVTGKDIENNKCSWLAVVCMQKASENEKQIMLECYGQKDPEKVAKVKQLYKDLGLQNTYEIYKEESYNMIKIHIEQTSLGPLHDIFYKILNKTYQTHS